MVLSSAVFSSLAAVLSLRAPACLRSSCEPRGEGGLCLWLGASLAQTRRAPMSLAQQEVGVVQVTLGHRPGRACVG